MLLFNIQCDLSASLKLNNEAVSEYSIISAPMQSLRVSDQRQQPNLYPSAK